MSYFYRILKIIHLNNQSYVSVIKIKTLPIDETTDIIEKSQCAIILGLADTSQDIHN